MEHLAGGRGVLEVHPFQHDAAGGGPAGRALAGGPREAYVLTSYPGVPTSRAVFLNGAAVELVDAAAATLPALDPKVLPAGADVEVPAQSYGFVVLPGVGAPACA